MHTIQYEIPRQDIPNASRLSQRTQISTGLSFYETHNGGSNSNQVLSTVARIAQVDPERVIQMYRSTFDVVVSDDSTQNDLSDHDKVSALFQAYGYPVETAHYIARNTRTKVPGAFQLYNNQMPPVWIIQDLLDQKYNFGEKRYAACGHVWDMVSLAFDTLNIDLNSPTEQQKMIVKVLVNSVGRMNKYVKMSTRGRPRSIPMEVLQLKAIALNKALDRNEHFMDEDALSDIMTCVFVTEFARANDYAIENARSWNFVVDKHFEIDIVTDYCESVHDLRNAGTFCQYLTRHYYDDRDVLAASYGLSLSDMNQVVLRNEMSVARTVGYETMTKPIPVEWKIAAAKSGLKKAMSTL